MARPGTSWSSVRARSTSSHPSCRMSAMSPPRRCCASARCRAISAPNSAHRSPPRRRSTICAAPRRKRKCAASERAARVGKPDGNARFCAAGGRYPTTAGATPAVPPQSARTPAHNCIPRRMTDLSQYEFRLRGKKRELRLSPGFRLHRASVFREDRRFSKVRRTREKKTTPFRRGCDTLPKTLPNGDCAVRPPWSRIGTPDDHVEGRKHDATCSDDILLGCRGGVHLRRGKGKRRTDQAATGSEAVGNADRQLRQPTLLAAQANHR